MKKVFLFSAILMATLLSLNSCIGWRTYYNDKWMVSVHSQDTLIFMYPTNVDKSRDYLTYNSALLVGDTIYSFPIGYCFKSYKDKYCFVDKVSSTGDVQILVGLERWYRKDYQTWDYDSLQHDMEKYGANIKYPHVRSIKINLQDVLDRKESKKKK